MHLARNQKPPQRNITPIFVIAKRKNTIKQKSEDNQGKSDRGSSKTSKCSFQPHQKKTLHIDALKKGLLAKNKPLGNQQPKGIKVHNTTFDKTQNETEDSRRTNSNPNKKIGQQNNVLGIGRRIVNNDSSLSRKKSNGSGKIVFRDESRSQSKRSDNSIDKNIINSGINQKQLMLDFQNFDNNQNKFGAIKIRRQKQKKKQIIKPTLLNLNITVKGPEALNEYQLFGQLGKGAYGVVRIGVCKDGSKVAIKKYPKKHLSQMNRLKNLQRQINILSSLNHPIIAKLIQTIETETDIYLVLEYGGANSLYNYLLSKHEHRLKQHEAKKFLLTISQTVAYLHRKNIVHRDIKAENILINRFKQLKLIDFGFSIHSIPPNTIDTFCGTPTYMAPEIVSKMDHVPIYTDMWSLGILYFVMLQGNYPFRSRNEQDLFEKIKKGKFEYLHNDISDESKKLIELLLKVNPYQRLTIEDILSSKWEGFFSDARLQTHQ